MGPEGLLDYLAASPTSGHAVEKACEILREGGFTGIPEHELWDGGLPREFFVRRGTGSLVAVRQGTERPAVSGFRIACAHTDFPGLRLRSNPVRQAGGHSVLSVEIYGSPILSTWFDRDLGLAGTAVSREPGGPLRTKPFRLPGMAARISMPAMHLNRGMNEDGFTFNKEDHLQPILTTGSFTDTDLAEAVAGACGLKAEELAGWTAHLVDIQPPSVGGIRGGFVTGQGIDDLAMCHSGLEALLSAGAAPSTSVLCLFDNEEVGSSTCAGAQSGFLDNVLECLSGSPGEFHRALLGSILVSIDAAHAVNPAWESKFERGSRPMSNAGPVIKVNAQERYATSALTGAYFRECAQAAGSPVQVFACRNDIPCGSTIGPMLATRLGIPSVDAGNPVMSMHSIRECTGVEDHGRMTAVLARHFEAAVSL